MPALESPGTKSERRSTAEKAASIGRAEELLTSGMTRAAVARELGISPSTLRRWLGSDQSSGNVTLVGKRKQQEREKAQQQDEEIAELRADLDAADARYRRLVNNLEVAAFVVGLLLLTLLLWSPWSTQKRLAQSAAGQYYAAQSNYLNCSKYALNTQLANCYRSYDSALSRISWPAAAQPTAAALHTDIQNIIKKLSSGGDVTGAVAMEATDVQTLSTTLLALESE